MCCKVQYCHCELLSICTSISLNVDVSWLCRLGHWESNYTSIELRVFASWRVSSRGTSLKLWVEYVTHGLLHNFMVAHGSTVVSVNKYITQCSLTVGHSCYLQILYCDLFRLLCCPNATVCNWPNTVTHCLRTD